MAFQTPLVYQNNAHSPMLNGDFVAPAVLPVSAKTGNTLVARTDGLYAGIVPDRTAIYINSAGNDVTTAGDKATPYKTLDYALSQLATVARAGQRIYVAMQSGQTFAMAQHHVLPCDVVLTWYGDATYGDFNSANVNNAPNATMLNLVRPIVAPANLITNGQNRIASLRTPVLIVLGAQVNLPAVPGTLPDPGAYGVMDFYYAPPYGSGSLVLEGAVVNATDTQGFSGIVGILSRSQITLAQFASQFLVNGAKVEGGVDATVLATRPRFVHFYSDVPGTSNIANMPPLNPTALNSSNGSGLLTLHWTDTPQQQIGATSNLGTFPILNDANFGLRQYITGIRKNGAVPVNVICPRVGL